MAPALSLLSGSPDESHCWASFLVSPHIKRVSWHQSRVLNTLLMRQSVSLALAQQTQLAADTEATMCKNTSLQEAIGGVVTLLKTSRREGVYRLLLPSELALSLAPLSPLSKPGESGRLEMARRCPLPAGVAATLSKRRPENEMVQCVFRHVGTNSLNSEPKSGHSFGTLFKSLVHVCLESPNYSEAHLYSTIVPW